MISYNEMIKNGDLNSYANRKDGTQEDKKMGYNAKEAEETKGMAELPKDTIFDGVIIDIKDGKVSDFIPEGTPWKGDIENPAINLKVEVKVGDKQEQFTQLFTYINEDNKTKFTPGSNLGKFNKKYGKLPETGDQIKIISNSDGYGKIKLD